MRSVKKTLNKLLDAQELLHGIRMLAPLEPTSEEKDKLRRELSRVEGIVRLLCIQWGRR